VNRLDITRIIGEFLPMLSRRDLLIRSTCTAGAAALGTRLRAETADGFTVLRAEVGGARFDGPDQPARPIWGFGGAVPGPLIRVRRGDEVKVRLVNALAEPTAIHWHGVRIVNAMDGAPRLTQMPVEPGASFDYRFAVPDAGTFWYHAPLAPSVASPASERGLYGALIVDELMPPQIDRDQILLFADQPPEAAATAVAAADAGTGSESSRRFIINGAPSVDVPVRANERVRLRFVNASARVMRARIDGHRLVVVAFDGQPSEPFAARDSMVVLGPGNRVDIFVDAVREPGSIAPIMFATGDGETALARLVYDTSSPVRAAPLADIGPLAMPFSADAAVASRPTANPATLQPLPEWMNLRRALRVTLPIDASGASAGTGEAGSGALRAPMFTVERGRTVVIALDSRTSAHAVHVHGHHFRLLDRLDDGWKPYWLDTVPVGPRETTRIAFVADNPGRWLIEQQALDGAGGGGGLVPGQLKLSHADQGGLTPMKAARSGSRTAADRPRQTGPRDPPISSLGRSRWRPRHESRRRQPRPRTGPCPGP
jgi:FtsP/CotA-like multicopper oxidase with cupredoxin domain